MIDLEFNENKGFYNVPKLTKKEHEYYRDNDGDVVIYKKFFNKKKEIINTQDYALYKKRYTHYFLDIENKKKVNLTKKSFNYNKPIYSLNLFINDLEKISYLPPGLLVLYLQGVGEHAGWGFDLKIIPKSLVSISYRWGPFNMNGWDISVLKNLKVFSADDNSTTFTLPKFPKSIEYINFKKGSLTNEGIKNFNILDYPNLKYFNVSNNMISKIPKKWIQLKKDKKLKIYFGSQRKSIF